MKLTVFFALLLSCACATPARPSPKIYTPNNGGRLTGGQNAVRNQFPYQVSFQWGLSGSYQHWCGGSIISPLFVLTSGFCITDLPSGGNTRIVAGILNINEDGVVRNIISYLVHPLFQGNTGPYDLGLLGLESALSFSESIQPIALSSASSEPQDHAILSGWGDTDTTAINPNFPSILQYIELPVLSYDQCAAAIKALLGTDAYYHVTNLCTGPLYNGISGCTGDTGTPLVQKGPNNNTELIGVTSWGLNPCGFPGAPTIYVKVSSFIDFISANVPDLP